MVFFLPIFKEKDIMQRAVLVTKYVETNGGFQKSLKTGTVGQTFVFKVTKVSN